MTQKEKNLQYDENIMMLVVEDSITQAENLMHILSEAGYACTHVENAVKGLEYLSKNHVSIVISDVMMPKMDGFQFCNAVKQNPALAGLPVVLTTTLSDPGDIIKGLESGADNFIAKPYEKEHLLSQMEYMLANLKLRSLSQQQNIGAQDMGMEIYFAGKRHYIMSSQLQILDLLISTFEVFLHKNQQLNRMNNELSAKNERIKALTGLIPICANCKKIRDDHGYWTHVDLYLEEHSDAGFNRSICPNCSATGE